MPTGARRGFLALVSGTAAGQGLAILAAPVLSRLYSPSAFGVFIFILTISGILAVVASLRLDYAIPLTSSLDEARNLTRASMWSSAIVGALTLAGVVVFDGPLSSFAGFEFLPWGLWLPLLVTLTAVFNILSQAALRSRKYGAVARRTVIQGVGTVVGQLGAAIVSRSPGGLLSGQLLGRSLGIVALARTSKTLLRRADEETPRATMRRYWRFPVVFAPSALINTLGASLPLLVVASRYGVHEAGLLGLTQRLAAVPAALVGVAVGQVFSAEISARIRNGQSHNRDLFLRTAYRLGVLGFVITVGLFTIAPWLLPVALGHRWAGSGGYAEATALVVGVGFVISPLSFVFLAYERVRSLALLDILRVGLVLGPGLLCYELGLSPITAVWAMSAGQLVTYAITWFVALRIVTQRLPVLPTTPSTVTAGSSVHRSTIPTPNTQLRRSRYLLQGRSGRILGSAVDSRGRGRPLGRISFVRNGAAHRRPR